MDSKSSLTPIQVAEMLKITKNTVYELIKRGELPSYKIGKKLRVELEDVEEYINSQRQSTKKILSINNFSNTSLVKQSTSDQNSFIISGQDIILDILARYIEESFTDSKILRSYKGSYNGLYDLYNNNVSIASSHLWDGDTDEYNIEYVKRLVPGIPCLIINLAYRIQGFYVQKGNPFNILSIADLTKPNIKIVNREKGSGTRILLDENLRLLNINPLNILGYTDEETSHLAVASKVGRGEAHVGLGNKKASMQVEAIDFIPFKTERYDLVIKKQDFENPIFQAVLEVVKSDKFRNEIIGIGGYDLKDIGKIIETT